MPKVSLVPPPTFWASSRQSSPIGDAERKHHPPKEEERHRAFTGKIAGLIFDRLGDFEGFLLDTEEGEHKFLARKSGYCKETDAAASAAGLS